MKPSDKFCDLVELISILRRECPWDRKQTPHTIKQNLIEEAYEAVDAIDNNDPEELSRELGDLLLHVIFQSKMASEEEHFTISDVIWRISEKLIRRHPHVFGKKEVSDDEEVAENWEIIKLKEGRKSLLDGIPSHLPGLIKAQRMQEKASNVGFDWNDWKLAWEKFEEESEEWKEAVDQQDEESRQEEFGDLLFSLVNVGRLLGLNAEDALRQANRKFERRFRYIEEQLSRREKSLADSTLEEMDFYWEEAKKSEKAP